MVALNFDCAVRHSIYRLIYNNCSAWLSHNFIDLVPFSTNEQGYHSLGNKNDDREVLSPDFFKDLVNVGQ